MERQFEHNIYTSLELETGKNQYALVGSNELKVAFGYTTGEEYDYVDRVYRQLRVKTANSQEVHKSPVVAEVVNDQDSRFLTAIKQNKLENTNGALTVLDSSRGKIFIPELPYLVVSDDETTPPSVWSITSMPEIGLSVTIHKSIALQQFEAHPNILPFHANAIVDTRTGKSIVFSNPAIPGGVKKGGKTTMTLSSVMQNDSPFAFFTNENLYLEPSENSVNPILIPAEVNVSKRSIEEIRKDGGSIFVEKYPWDFNGEMHYMTTAGAMEDAEYKIASEMEAPSVWAFIDLNPESQDYCIRDISPEEARGRFLGALKTNRLALFHTPVLQGERFTESDQTASEVFQEDAKANALKTFANLLTNGTRFCTIEGGLDRNKLYELTLELTK